MSEFRDRCNNNLDYLMLIRDAFSECLHPIFCLQQQQKEEIEKNHEMRKCEKTCHA